jgi:hypothetical protein
MNYCSVDISPWTEGLVVVAGSERKHSHSGHSSFATTRTSVQADKIVLLARSLFLQIANVFQCIMSYSLQVITLMTFVSYEMCLRKNKQVTLLTVLITQIRGRKDGFLSNFDRRREALGVRLRKKKNKIVHF